MIEIYHTKKTRPQSWEHVFMRDLLGLYTATGANTLHATSSPYTLRSSLTRAERFTRPYGA